MDAHELVLAEDALVQIAEDLEQASEAYMKAAVQAAEARHEYEFRMAQAIVRIKARGEKMAIAEVEARALVELENEHYSKLTTDALADALRRKIGALQHRGDLQRTRVASLRVMRDGPTSVVDRLGQSGKPEPKPPWPA